MPPTKTAKRGATTKLTTNGPDYGDIRHGPMDHSVRP